jgi:cytoskeletal protein RodZ
LKEIPRLIKSRDPDKQAISEFRKGLGAFFRQKRIEVGIGLESAAESIGVATSFLSNIERGATNTPNYALRKMMEIYQIPEKELLTNLHSLESTYWKTVLQSGSNARKKPS